MPLLSTFIDLPDNVATSTLGYAGNIIGDLSPLWILAVGVLLGGVVLGIIIRAFFHH